MKTMYTEPKQGIYTYQTRKYSGTFERFRQMVKVLGETEHSFLILCPGCIDGHNFGDEMWVRRKSVKMPRAERPAVDCSGAWWNN